MFKDLSPTRENKGRLALPPEGRFLSFRQAVPPGFASEGYFELISEGGHTLEWVWPRDGRTKAGQQTTVDEVRSAGMTGWQRSMLVPRTLSDRGAAAAVGLEFVLLIPNDETRPSFHVSATSTDILVIGRHQSPLRYQLWQRVTYGRSCLSARGQTLSAES